MYRFRCISLFTFVTVYARDDAAFADIESAMHSADFSQIERVRGPSATYENRKQTETPYPKLNPQDRDETSKQEQPEKNRIVYYSTVKS